MSRKKNAMPEATLDKMDDYLKHNYMKIITVAAIILIAFILFYGFKQVKQSANAKSNERIGALENAGLATSEQISEYVKLAATGKSADYVHYQASLRFNAIGDTAAAAEESAKVSGEFASYAESLRYDLDGGDGAVSAAQVSGAFSPVWYYRAVLAASEADAPALMENFRTAYPDSFLLEQLNKWGF